MVMTSATALQRHNCSVRQRRCYQCIVPSAVDAHGWQPFVRYGRQSLPASLHLRAFVDGYAAAPLRPVAASRTTCTRHDGPHRPSVKGPKGNSYTHSSTSGNTCTCYTVQTVRSRLADAEIKGMHRRHTSALRDLQLLALPTKLEQTPPAGVDWRSVASRSGVAMLPIVACPLDCLHMYRRGFRNGPDNKRCKMSRCTKQSLRAI